MYATVVSGRAVASKARAQMAVDRASMRGRRPVKWRTGSQPKPVKRPTRFVAG